jgi:hypothetical protein
MLGARMARAAKRRYPRGIALASITLRHTSVVTVRGASRADAAPGLMQGAVWPPEIRPSPKSREAREATAQAALLASMAVFIPLQANASGVVLGTSNGQIIVRTLSPKTRKKLAIDSEARVSRILHLARTSTNWFALAEEVFITSIFTFCVGWLLRWC